MDTFVHGSIGLWAHWAEYIDTSVHVLLSSLWAILGLIRLPSLEVQGQCAVGTFESLSYFSQAEFFLRASFFLKMASL